MKQTEQAPIAIFRGPNQPDTDIESKVSQLEALLKEANASYQSVRFASSLAAEDNVIFDAIARLYLPIQTFSLNTGRLHDETLQVATDLKQKYGKAPTWFEPNPKAVQAYVNTHGRDAFYESVELRKACCNMRKVEPLKRALTNADAWITGQRQAQAATRTNLPESEFDQTHNIQKFNPLAAWSEADVWTYIRKYDVPVNPLHFQGYPSIGCAPCTRPIAIGEEIRAGRWWWEDPSLKECGLHTSNLKR